jgi:hypothetical protein
LLARSADLFTLDDLVAQLSRQHDWPANLTASYLAALQRARLWHVPERGW